MREAEHQLDISCHQMTLPVLRLDCSELSCSPKESHGNLQKIQAVRKTRGCFLQTDKDSIVVDSTQTTHRTWKGKADTYIEPSSLYSSVFGMGRYSAGYQKRNIHTNLAIKPLLYNLSCQQIC